jgi:hypothetical protein
MCQAVRTDMIHVQMWNSQEGEKRHAKYYFNSLQSSVCIQIN